MIARERLDAADPFLRHKTTRRGAYDRAHAEAVAAGCDEALLLNTDGRLADASYQTVFVRRGGRLLTPPIEGGALPGILRAILLEVGAAEVAALTADDLTHAEAVYVGNSLRGLRPAVLANPITPPGA